MSRKRFLLTQDLSRDNFLALTVYLDDKDRLTKLVPDGFLVRKENAKGTLDILEDGLKEIMGDNYKTEVFADFYGKTGISEILMDYTDLLAKNNVDFEEIVTRLASEDDVVHEMAEQLIKSLS